MLISIESLLGNKFHQSNAKIIYWTWWETREKVLIEKLDQGLERRNFNLGHGVQELWNIESIAAKWDHSAQTTVAEEETNSLQRMFSSATKMRGELTPVVEEEVARTATRGGGCDFKSANIDRACDSWSWRKILGLGRLVHSDSNGGVFIMNLTRKN